MRRNLLYGMVDLQLTHHKQRFSLLFSSSVSSFSSMKFVNFSTPLYFFVVVVVIVIYAFSFVCDVYPVSIKLCISCAFLNRAHPSHSQSCTAMREQKTLWWIGLFHCLFTQSRVKPGNLILYKTSGWISISCVISLVCKLFLNLFHFQVLFNL